MALRPRHQMITAAIIVALAFPWLVGGSISTPAHAQDLEGSVFVENVGQRAAGVAFSLDLPDGLRLDIGQDGARIVAYDHSISGEASTVRMALEGTRRRAPQGQHRLLESGLIWSSDAIGEPRVDVPLHRGVEQRDIYAGVDLVYDADAGGVTRVLHVAAGAGMDAVTLRYDGQEAPDVDGNRLRIGAIEERVSAREMGVGGRVLDTRYVPLDGGRIGVHVEGRSPERDLEVALRLDLDPILPDGARAPRPARLAEHPLLLERVPGAAEGDLLFFENGSVDGDASPDPGAKPAAVAQAGGSPIQGGDYNCRALFLTSGDVLDPTLPYEDLLLFDIPAGETVDVLDGTGQALRVEADYVDVAGTLDARGAGFGGGAGAPQTGDAFVVTPGNDGAGPGGGSGAGGGSFFTEAAGGGGGGYGGNGGAGGIGDDGGSPGAGGPSYGMALPPGIELGSGGGSGSSNDRDSTRAGGDGGGAVVINASEIRVDGTLNAAGIRPGNSAAGGSGGGSGGGIYLDAARTATGTGAVRVDGGSGSDGTSFGGGGGGGAGGRVKFAGALDPGAPWTISAAGAGGGGSFFGTSGQAGQAGTIDSSLAVAPDPDAPLVVGCLADLSIDIDVLGSGDSAAAPPPSTVWAGEELVYRVGVFNRGPRLAVGTTVSVTLPQDVAYLGDTDACTPQPGDPTVLSCDLGDIEAFDGREFQIKTRVDPGAVRDTDNGTRAIVTEASVTSLTPDPNLENNVDDVRGFIQDLADLKITKIVEPHSGVKAGDQFTYTLLVDNLGPSSARNVVITDTLVTSGFVDANGCSIAVRTDGGAIDEFICNFALSTGVFDLGTFGSNWLNPRSPSDMGRIIITINATAEEGLDLTNVATVTADTPDPDASNNMAMVPLEVEAVADLSVTKTAVGEVQVAGQMGQIFDINDPGAFPAPPNPAASSTNATAGKRIRYTVEVTNNGPSRAENVVISDRLPAGVTIVPGSLTITQGSCETGTPGEPLDRMTCGIGRIPSGDVVTLTFDVYLDPSLDPGAVLENDVAVYSDTTDMDNSDNHAHVQTIVNTWADMEITKLSVGQNKTGYDSDLRRFILEDLPGEVTAGHELRYEITVQNKGASDARNVQILDLLPGQNDTGLDHDPVTFLRADGTTCRPLDEQQEIGVFGAGGGTFGQVVWCDVGTVPAGARVTFDIYVEVDAAVPDGFTLTNGTFVWWGPSSPPADPAAFLPFPFPQIPPSLPTTDDPFLDNNFADTETDVNAVADVYIEKIDVPASDVLDQANEPDRAVAGEEHRYLIGFGNKGWSVAREVAIQDFLDVKQFGPGGPILGERFVRCEPFDIDDFVSCSEDDGVVDVDLLLKGNEQIVPGDLNPGDMYGFYLVTEVDPGYVLDADDFIATNDSRITTTTTDFRGANNVSAHDTEIIAEADLTVEKVDDAAGFLQCDPVQPGGMITYEITVTNEGPSDAAEVWLVDQLPAEGVVLDPDQVNVTVSRGDIDSLLVRDDGYIEVRIGNDVNNSGTSELGRINAGSAPVVVTIQVMVAEAAECGADVTNEAWVETRENAVMWPDAPDLLPGVGGGPRTPTVDPDPSNNRATEATTVECPAVTVTKTVSFDAQCPGVDLEAVQNQVGQPVTYCYEITNNGTTFLDTIQITDTLDSRTIMPTVIFTDTITFGEDEGVPVAPGETVTRQVTVDHVTKECGIVTNTVEVTANPVNSGRTDLPCLTDVTATDSARIDVPCAGLDWRLQLPVLGGDECETWIQVQNVGACNPTIAMLVVWGEPGFCPPQAAGPLKSECSGLIRPGSSWSFAGNQLPRGSRSAVVYSLSGELVNAEDGGRLPFGELVCDEFFFGAIGDHLDWARFDSAYRTGRTWNGFDLAQFRGEAIVASVNRSCPDVMDENISNHAAYVGISSDIEGAFDPVTGAHMYYAPLVFAGRGALDTTLNIQNSGVSCTSLEVWFKAQDDCLRPILGDVLALAPGETVQFDPTTVVGPDWLGNAWIRSTQPLGVIADTHGPNHFTSYTGLPADIYELDYTFGNQVNYAPLVYSEYQGWDAALQVQNLSGVTAAKVKVYFLDRSGDIITTLVDWICPRGSQTFFLPTIASIPGNWVGSARVESQEWWTPGQPLVEPPRVSSVVLLEKWSDPARTTRREAVAYNAQTECLLFDWQLGSGKGGTASGSAVFAIPLVAKDYNGITSEIGITNLVPKPGFTDFAIFLYDQNGLLDWYCQKLGEKEVEYIDMNTWGVVPQRFLGSMVVSAVFWEHDVFDDRGQFQRNLVGLGAVAVERVGATLNDDDVPGDESKAFEAIPVFDHFCAPAVPQCVGLPPRTP